jgi:hypothetical protein
MKTIKIVIACLCFTGLYIGLSSSSLNNVAGKSYLKFLIKKGDGSTMKGVTISVSASKNDLDSARFLAIKITDINGKANFGKLEEGDYYYQLDVSTGIPYHKEGIATIKAGKNEWQEISVNNEK